MAALWCGGNFFSLLNYYELTAESTYKQISKMINIYEVLDKNVDCHIALCINAMSC